MDMFEKRHIKAGYLLVMHDNIAKEDFNVTVNYGSGGKLGACAPQGRDFFPIESLDENLARKGIDVDVYVKAVYGYTSNKDMLANEIGWRNIIWARPEAKKLTVEEIEKLLGYPVEIISENKPQA